MSRNFITQRPLERPCSKDSVLFGQYNEVEKRMPSLQTFGLLSLLLSFDHPQPFFLTLYCTFTRVLSPPTFCKRSYLVQLLPLATVVFLMNFERQRLLNVVCPLFSQSISSIIVHEKQAKHTK